MNKKFFQFSLCLVCSVSIYSQTHLLSSPSGTIKNNLATDSSFQKFKTDNTSINDHYIYIDINQVKMYLSNNGDGSHDPRTGNGGFYWPGGLSATQTAIFEDGLIWGGKVDGDIRVNGNTHRQGLQAGKILSNGKADDPKLPRYRVFKIRKDWESFPPGPERDSFEKDYKEWPIEDGAPWTDMNGDGIYTTGTDQPRFDGDEVLWYVANDMDSARTKRTFGKPPMGLEEQCAIFGFNRGAEVIPNTGHLVFLEAPDRYRELVLDFLSK
ncbi:MAG: alpha/beta fold hydrolase [Syntrophothermus sp.]